jgi:hypothetical protein
MKFNKEWSKINEANYKWLYGYMNENYKDIDEFTFIDSYKRSLMGIIENNDNWGDSSKEALLFTVGKYLKLFGNEKYGKLYSDKGREYMMKIRDVEGENKQDEKEIENYRNRDYFINILQNIDFKEIQTVVEHYKYLLLSLLVYQPPLRTSFYTTARFMRKKADNNKKDNYVWITKRGGLKCVLIVNEDKVKNTRKYASNMYLSYIDVENQNLCDLINYSFEKYPRTFLFENNGKGISNGTLLYWLRSITGVEKINVDMMRSSYINDFYDSNRNFKEKETLSRQMRHSVMTAQNHYLKTDIQTAKENKEDKIVELQIENHSLKNDLKECEDKPEDKKAKKLRRDVVYLLNKKGVSPREATLKKYNIVFDKELNKWI